MRNARDYGNIVSQFLNLIASYACVKNETYKQFLEEEERKEMASERRETTSKYNPFQNKNYNINY